MAHRPRHSTRLSGAFIRAFCLFPPLPSPATYRVARRCCIRSGQEGATQKPLARQYVLHWSDLLRSCVGRVTWGCCSRTARTLSMLMYYVFAIATARLHRPGRPPVPASLLLGLPIANCPRPRPPSPPSPPPLSSPLLSPVSPHSQCSFSSPSLLDIAEGAYRHAAKHAAAAPESLSGGRVDSGHHQGDARDRVRPSVRQTLSSGRPARPRPRERGPEIERLLSERDRDRFAFVTQDGAKLWRGARKGTNGGATRTPSIEGRPNRSVYANLHASDDGMHDSK